jgi:hypothetical protein
MCDSATDTRIEDLGARSDDEIESEFLRVQRLSRSLQARSAELLGEIERRGLPARTGHTTVVSWVGDRLQEAWSSAERSVALSRSLPEMPATREALSSGDLSSSALSLLVSARDASPEDFAASEDGLVAAARTLPPKLFRREVRLWRARLDDAAAAAERVYKRRYLRVWPTPIGSVRVEGEFDPENGQALLSALSEATGPPGVDDERTPDQRRVDALGEIARTWLGRGRRSRPVLNLVVDVRDFVKGSGAELEDAGWVTQQALERIACDASVSRIVMAGRSDILDVGRLTPIVPPAIRRALHARDRGCVGPGCDRSPDWCEAHHIVFWSRGGSTALTNLVLVCRRHHHDIHEGGWRLELTSDGPIFTSPKGHVVEGRAPPAAA